MICEALVYYIALHSIVLHCLVWYFRPIVLPGIVLSGIVLSGIVIYCLYFIEWSNTVFSCMHIVLSNIALLSGI